MSRFDPFGFGLLVAVCVTLLVGCTTRLAPPPAESEEVVSVFVLDHGRHTSLVVPAGPETLVRYAYGDWRYYAQMETGLWRGMAALFWPTRAALGRAEFEGEPTEAGVRRGVPVGIATVYELSVEPKAVTRLRQELDELFEAGATMEQVTQPRWGLTFVPHPRAYWSGYNSNHMIRDWLERLGVETRGWPVWASWELDDRK